MKYWVLPNWPTGELQFSSSPYSFASLLCLPSPSSFHVLSDHSISFPGTEHSPKQVCTSTGLVGWLQNCGKCVKTIAFSTETYEFLATEDTNRDKVNDILFVLQSSEGSQNNTCTGAGMTYNSHLITVGSTERERERVCVFYLNLPSLYFSRSTIAVCVFHSSGWDRWKCPVGVSIVPWISLGSVWSGSGCK